MINETVVTLQGWLGGDVQLRQAGDSLVANFRVACTPRRFNRRTGEWADGDTQWYSVSAWRALAENCERSLRRGDPVVIHGRLSARSYVNNAGVEVTSFEVEALFVGHDLAKGVSRFARTPKPATPDGETAQAAAQEVTASAA